MIKNISKYIGIAEDMNDSKSHIYDHVEIL